MKLESPPERASSPEPVVEAFDAIAEAVLLALPGEWEYPGQVVRDVQLLVDLAVRVVEVNGTRSQCMLCGGLALPPSQFVLVPGLHNNSLRHDHAHDCPLRLIYAAHLRQDEPTQPIRTPRNRQSEGSDPVRSGREDPTE